MTNKITTYQFDIEDAKLYGLEEAVFLYNLKFWLTKNLANNKHIYDGEVWTYNSVKAYTEIFPFWSEDKIYKLIKSMEEKKIIISGNYNNISYDRTKWYSIPGFSNIHSVKQQNGSCETTEPIPDNNTYKKPYIKQGGNNLSVFSLPQKLQDNPEFVELWEQFLKQRKSKTNTKYALDLIMKKLKGKTVSEAMSMLEQSITNGWQGLFPIKQGNNTIRRWEVEKENKWIFNNWETYIASGEFTDETIISNYKQEVEEWVKQYYGGKKLIW